ncbi:MAG TPA: hypothetical protein VKB67_13330, partial [Rhizomicrobium sp.]|nr:hypothetical protein [Rhizomicrobium sp.]
MEKESPTRQSELFNFTVRTIGILLFTYGVILILVATLEFAGSPAVETSEAGFAASLLYFLIGLVCVLGAIYSLWPH